MDKIFIINLIERVDRKKSILNEIDNNNITNYEFFNAIRPSIDEVNKWNSEFLKKHVERYKIGCLGCLLSHYNVIKLAIERGYNEILILEDDSKFKRSINELYKIINKFKKYDMLYLSGSHLGKKTKVSNSIMKVEGTYTTAGYIIKKNVMEYLLKNIVGYKKEVDVFYAEEVQTRFNCYCIIPHIIYQSEGYSDIQGKNVKYKCLE